MTSEIYELIFRGLQAKYPGQAIGPRFQAVCAALDEWDESKHPRKDNGQFGTGSGQGGKKQQKQAKQMHSINEIVKKIDFTNDNILPAISKEDAEMLGVQERPYLLKKSVGARNKIRHPDIDDEKAKEILVRALYQRDKILQGTHDNKPDYYHFAAFVDNHNYLALVDFTPSKEYNEIVHYHIMRQKEFMRLVRHTIEKNKKIYK